MDIICNNTRYITNTQNYKKVFQNFTGFLINSVQRMFNLQASPGKSFANTLQRYGTVILVLRKTDHLDE